VREASLNFRWLSEGGKELADIVIDIRVNVSGPHVVKVIVILNRLALDVAR